MAFATVTLDALTIEDAASFRGLALYRRLEDWLRRSGHRFAVPARGAAVSWDRVAFLNLTFWSPDQAVDVLPRRRIAADVVAHVAWHGLAAHALRDAGGATPEALLFGEAIASAFDLYLLGRLLASAPDSRFVATQLPLMTEAAREAGVPRAGMAALLRRIAAAPEQAFEDMRALLFESATALSRCDGPLAAAAVLERFRGHRFHALLHHYQLSNWILYGRACGARAPRASQAVWSLHRTLRRAAGSLAWLEARWLDGPAAGQRVSTT